MFYITTGIFVLLIGLALTYGSILLAHAKNFHDHPDDLRKFHDIPTPTTGGLAIGVAFLIGIIVFMTINGTEASQPFKNFLWYFLIGSIITFCVGVFDDIFGLSFKPKFLLQIMVALISLIGIRNEYLLTYETYLESSILFKGFLYLTLIFWIVACSNLINLIDGVDSLAGSITLTIISGLAVIGSTWLFPEVGMILIPLTAATIAFLIFNKPPAVIFMGDTGSLLIGYTLSITAIVTIFYAPHYSRSLSLIVLMAVPGIDTLFAIIRRIKFQKNPFESDHYHNHHILQTYFKSPALTVITLSTMSISFVTIAILLANTTNDVIYFSVLGLLGALVVLLSFVYYKKLDAFISIVKQDEAFNELLKGHLKSQKKEESKTHKDYIKAYKN